MSSVPRSGRELPAAVALTLLSGGLMTWAGYVVAAGSIATALLITLPGWVAIEIAFRLIRRADARAQWPRPSPASRMREEGGILLAGGVMMLAGYAGAAWSWLVSVPLLVAGGFTIAAAGLTGHHPDHKRRVVRAAERYVANPPTKTALLLGLPMPLVLLETTGHKTGKRRRTPLMNGIVGEELWIVAEHGCRAAYVRNLLADPHVRVKIGRRWIEGRAEVLEKDDPVARAAWIAGRLGRSKSLERLAMRAFGVDPVTVRVDLSDAAPVTELPPALPRRRRVGARPPTAAR